MKYSKEQLKDRSIKTKVVTQVSIIIALILIIAFGFIVYLSIIHSKEKAELSLQHKTEKVFNQLEQQLRYLRENTELLAKNQLLVNAYIDQSDRAKYLPALIDNFKEGKYLSFFALVDFNGRIIFQKNDNESIPTTHLQELNLALNMAKTVVFFSTEEKRLVIIVPVQYYGATQGAVIAKYNIESIIQRHSIDNEDLYTKLIYNKEVIFSDGYEQGRDYYTYLADRTSEHQILRKLDFNMEMGIPKRYYLDPLKAQLFYLGLLGLVILAIGGWVSLYLATSITSPILKLYDRIKQISSEVEQGEYLPLGSKDELEVLGYAFYDKTKEIYELNQKLHSKVMEQLRLMEVAINNVRDAIYLLDDKGRFIYVNEGASFQLGYELETLLTKTIFDIDLALNESIWSEAWEELQIKKHHNLDANHRKKDGSIFPVEIESYFITYHNKNYILGLVKDVSERNALQKALQEERNRFALAVEGAQDALWDWNLLTGEVYLTERFEVMLGYEVGELPQTVDAWFGLLNPADKEKTMKDIEDYFDSKGESNFQSIFRLRCKKGSWRWIMGRGKAKFDSQGNPIRFVGFNTDITEQKHKEELILEQKNELETIFNHAQDAIAIIDLESNFLSFNKAFIDLTKYPEEILLTKKCSDLTVQEDREKNEKAIQNAIKSGNVEFVEKTCMDSRGNRLIVSMSVSLLPDHQRLLLILHDMTKSKLLHEQSKLAAMGEMIGNIAHQWRQPLTIISTGATGMKVKKEYGFLSDEEFNEICDAINDNAQYLSKTIDDFRDFIKGERKLVEFNLTDDINSFLHLVEGAIKNNDIHLISNIKENINIKGYPNELIQCFINIFNNAKDALKDIKDERYIFVSTSVKDNNALITFKDNAGGIPADIIPHIFEPYFTTKHKSKGTGLGLSMSYTLIVEGMNGTIKADNVAYKYKDKEYKGAQFVITLPLNSFN